MKYFFTILIFLFAYTVSTCAQNFVTRGKIEFEVKRNTKRMFKNTSDGDDPFLTNLPDVDISYYDLIFSWNQSIYQPGRKNTPPSIFLSEAAVYADLNKQQRIRKFMLVDEYYIMEDSINKINWRIVNETRKIAGWDCRKAIGIISDSIYVVAFYCPEIIPNSGPDLFSGLPGMILGLAIPRMYTTWFATKIEIANIDESKIIPPAAGKSKLHTKREMAEIMLQKFKEHDWPIKSSVEEIMKNIGGYTL